VLQNKTHTEHGVRAEDGNNVADVVQVHHIPPLFSLCLCKKKSRLGRAERLKDFEVRKRRMYASAIVLLP
jgi:hypothetical protein